MPPGRSTPALFELIKPVPPPHQGATKPGITPGASTGSNLAKPAEALKASAGSSPILTKPVHQVPAKPAPLENLEAHRPIEPNPAPLEKPLADKPERSADESIATESTVKESIIEPKARLIRDDASAQPAEPVASSPNAKSTTNSKKHKPSANGHPPPSIGRAPEPADKPAPAAETSTEPLPPPPQVHDPEREAARKVLGETWRDRWLGSWTDEWQRLIADRRAVMWMGVSLAVVALAGTYWLGHTRGKGLAEQKAREDINKLTGSDTATAPSNLTPKLNPGLITPPQPLADKTSPEKARPVEPSPGATKTSPTSAPPSAGNQPRPGTGEKIASNPPTPAPSPTAPFPAVITGPANDPREAGKNYLQLEGRLDLGTAERLVKFLTDHGLASIAVGVDRLDKPTNNPSSYAIFVAQGVTSLEYRERAAIVEELETRADKLGQRWKAEQKGWTTFSGKFWKKHVP
jgi:hypothetical protein